MLLELESFALPKILHTICLKTFMHFSLHLSLRMKLFVIYELLIWWTNKIPVFTLSLLKFENFLVIQEAGILFF